MLLGGLAIYEQKHNNNRSKEEGKIMNKKTLFSCTLWAIFALNSVAFAAEGSRSQLEEVTSDSLPIEITDVTLEGCTGTYDDRTGEYIFGQLEGIKSYSVENEYSVNVGDIDTENRHLDEMKLIESGGEETEFLDFSNKTEIMSIESSLPDLMVYDLVATTDLIVGQTQNRFSYKVANLGSSMAEDVEVTFIVDNRVVQINTNAFFGYMTQDLYASKLGAWNGITDKVKIKNVVVSSSDNISDETQVYILSDAEAFNLFPYTPAWTEQTGNSNALIVITLNDALMSTRTEEQCARTLIHELGHVFGMDHPNESEDGCEYASILYQSSYDNPTKCSSQVTGHDKYGLYNIYEDLSVQAANLEQGELCSNVLVYLDKLIQVDSEQVLSNNSDYIVKGRTLPNKQNIATDFSGYTQTNLIVDDVFKGEGLTQGEIIQIKEPYYTRVLDSGVEKTTYYDGYTPSEEGEEYIFFLNRLDNSNDFVLTFTSLSRYTANDIVVTGIFEENSVGYSEEIYKELREAVIEKYN